MSFTSSTGFYRKSAFLLVLYTVFTAFFGFGTVFLLQSQNLSFTTLNQLHLTSDSNLVLLPAVCVTASLCLLGIWHGISHTVVVFVYTCIQNGVQFNLESIALSRWLAPSAKQLLLKTLASTALLTTAFSPAFAQASGVEIENLHWSTSTATGSTSVSSQLSTSPTSAATNAKPVNITPPPPGRSTIQALANNETTAPTQSSQWTVSAGESLWKIAAKHLQTTDIAKIDSYWRQIWQENRTLIGADPNLIIPGQVLTLPTAN